MLMTLTVVSVQGSGLAEGTSKTFDAKGGTIGRAKGNDWVLPDKDRFVSNKHAVIEYHDNSFYIRDVSTNGVFINQLVSPIEQKNLVELSQGDRLYIGDYEISVCIDQVQARTEVSAITATGDQEVVVTTPTGSADRVRSTQHKMPGSDQAADLKIGPSSTVSDIEGVRFSSRGTSGDKAIWAAFLQGAGISVDDMEEIDILEKMFSLGSVYRIVVQGLMEILMARSNLKGDFRMSQTTIKPRENNPLKFSVNADEALRHLFQKGGGGYLSAEQAVQEGIQDIKDHQLAVTAGMHAAYEGVLRKFDPGELTRLFERYSKQSGLLTGYKKAKKWEQYELFYKKIVEQSAENYKEMFGEDFVRAYEEQIQKLASARLNMAGGDNADNGNEE